MTEKRKSPALRFRGYTDDWEQRKLGGLGIQYCIKTERAYSGLHEVKEDLMEVPYAEFNEKYNQRDLTARQKMRELVDSDANQVTKVFSTLFEE